MCIRDRFWPVNVLGAIAWSVSYGLLGYFFGVGFLAVQGRLGKILAWTLVAVIGVYVFYRLLRRYADQFTRDDLYIALVGSGAGALFGIIADRVDKHGAENLLDAQAASFASSFAPAAPFFGVVESATSFPVMGALALVAFAYFCARRRWWDATLVGLGVGGIIVLVGVITYLVATRADRPHAPLAAALVGAAVAGVAQLARLAQGVEYPSAVLAGMALGIAWLSITVLVVEFRLKRNPRAPSPA